MSARRVRRGWDIHASAESSATRQEAELSKLTSRRDELLRELHEVEGRVAELRLERGEKPEVEKRVSNETRRICADRSPSAKALRPDSQTTFSKEGNSNEPIPRKRTSSATRSACVEATVMRHIPLNGETYFFIRSTKANGESKYYFKRRADFEELHQKLLDEFKDDAAARERLPQSPNSWLDWTSDFKAEEGLQEYFDELFRDSIIMPRSLREFFGQSCLPDVKAAHHQSLLFTWKGMVEQAEAQARALREPAFEVGADVHIKNLRNKSKYNGRLGHVSAIEADGRYKVMLQSGGEGSKILAEENLELAHLPRRTSEGSRKSSGTPRSGPTRCDEAVTDGGVRGERSRSHSQATVKKEL